MSVAKIIEISAESPEGFEAAIQEGIRRASETVKNIRSAWVGDQQVEVKDGKVVNLQQVEVKDGKVVNYRVHLKVTFVLE